MSLPYRNNYTGDTRRLLLAFDIGTTFSGISYRLAYPCQEHVVGEYKTPTVIYYDSAGNICAIGAETLKEGIEEDAEENGWTKARWFKLYLRPQAQTAHASASDGQVDEALPPLPSNKTVVQLFSDYMKYLLECAKQYISDAHGKTVCTSLQSDITFVLTHPNGCNGSQQAQMRQAAIQAGLVPNTEAGRSRINFVTEGEATLHFCLGNGLALENTQQPGVLIVDVGESVIDVSAYRQLPNCSFEEITIPECHSEGAAFVTMRAKKFFEDLLSGTRFANKVEALILRFDKSTKHRFRKADRPQYIKFGRHSDRDASLNIRGGYLTLTGHDVAKFFEPTIFAQKSATNAPIQSVFLVGSLCASDWLLDQVRKRTEPLGLSVSRPCAHVNKAVSDGAILSYLTTDRRHPPRLLQAGDQAPGGVDDATTYRSSNTLSEYNAGSARPLTPEHRDKIIRTDFPRTEGVQAREKDSDLNERVDPESFNRCLVLDESQ
ncbi:hypothetical protein FA13DRAFT_1725557 [Coprinellus micaceus]|uniref:Actin-like ATPase domain-containing protein n=1 Tax=Coprinellus micaceus TaxID=71717 RepID=A0A4Y7TWD7_COPMI|nr:hypothetical protein FA13DRAFT_1725557 [Coprinellus micaceus]